MARKNTAARYRAAAKRLHENEGTLEIDDTAKVCGPTQATGRYVAAWVWVPDEEAEREKCHNCGALHPVESAQQFGDPCPQCGAEHEDGAE